LTRPILKFDLSDESDALQHEDGWRNTGHSAKTLVKHHDFRIVLIAMKKGARLEEHQTAGAISIQPSNFDCGSAHRRSSYLLERCSRSIADFRMTWRRW